MASVRINMRLDADLWAWAEQCAGERGISKTAVVENGLRGLRNGGDPMTIRHAQAHAAVLRAVAAGELVRPDVCSHCGKPPAGKGTIHAHHRDYDKPLEVEWLCPACHRREPSGENGIPNDFVMIRLPEDLCERIAAAGHKREPFVREAVEAALGGPEPTPPAPPRASGPIPSPPRASATSAPVNHAMDRQRKLNDAKYGRKR